MFFNGSNYFFALIASLSIGGFLILLQQVGYRVVGLFSGQHDVSENGILITKQVWFFSGIILLILSLCWILNMRFKNIFIVLFISIILSSALVRLIKGLFFAFGRGYNWYYIFLYFCTFEILPVVVLNKLIQTYLKT